MLRESLGLPLALFLGFVQLSSAQTHAANVGRPVVIFIHGRDEAFNIPAQLRDEWYGAFDAGLEKLGLVGLIPVSDRVFVHYEDVYEPDWNSAKGCTADSKGHAPEFDGSQAMATADAERYYRTRLGRIDLRDRIKTWLMEAALQLPGSRTFALQFFRDTKAYLEDPAHHCATNDHLWKALAHAQETRRPIILVGHSMGTLVAYDLLDGLDIPHKKLSVDRFVSLGSQLGVEGMVSYLHHPRVYEIKIGADAAAPRLVPIDAGSAFSDSPPFDLPAGMASWVNIRGESDFMAPFAVKHNFKIPPHYTFADLTIPTKPGSPHWVGAYLKDKVVVRAIAAGWCAGFKPPARPPTACAIVSDVK
jgi:hypothetical protein